ncbi:MAG TPA: hypothetical protein VG146_22475 [Verrucomicrobiae bacterium]|nr:hypothetical protein [Verrucomicrobiae bacterium]
MKEEVYIEQPSGLAPSHVKRVSWGAIFGGMFVTIVMQVMFTLLGVAVGIAKLNASQPQVSGAQIITGSGIWLLVTGLVSIWIGSCIAGRLCGGPQRADGMLHGIVSWSVAMVAMFLLLATTVGSVLGGTGTFIGNAISSQLNPANEPGPLADAPEVKGALPNSGALLPPTGRTEGQQPPGQLSALAQQDTDLASALARMESQGGPSKAPQARDQAINLLTTKHNLSQQDAASLLSRWDQEFQQAHVQNEQGTRPQLEWVPLWGFIALFLGLLVAAWGGWAGTSSVPVPVQAPTVAAAKT